MDIKDKKVLVTGSDGFIGSHLIERLIAEGCQIRAFVYYNSFNSWGWLDSLSRESLDKIEVFAGDIRDSSRVRQAMDNIEIVFHLAALIGIPYSYVSPESYLDTNIKGTLNVLGAARSVGVEKILVTSTSEVYGTAKYVPIDEVHPRQGQSPYSATKIGADCITESFYRSFSLPAVIVRPFNTYGPRQSTRAIIPAIITQLLAGKEEIQLGALHPTRDLVFVKDAAEGFVRIAASDRAIGQEINIATESEISIGDLASKLITTINPRAKVVTDKARLRPKKSEIERLLGSNKKLRELTGWSPKFSLDQGLESTVEWFRNRENLKLYKHDSYNV